MDNDKPQHALDVTLRAISRERDRLLGQRQIMSRSRRLDLDQKLAREFPVEAAVKRAAARREKSLRPRRLEISRALHERLRSELRRERGRFAEQTAPSLGFGGDAIPWRRLFGSKQLAALSAACLLIAAGIAFFGEGRLLGPRLAESGGSNRAGAANAGLVATTNDILVPLAGRSQLSLRVNRAEIAALQEPFFAANRSYFIDSSDDGAGMPLDLPVRVLLIGEGGLTRIP